MTTLQTYQKFNAFQAAIEKKFIVPVSNIMIDAVDKFIAAGTNTSQIDKYINITPMLLQVLNNLYYQCGYGYGWSVYKSLSAIKASSVIIQIKKQGNDEDVTPSSIAQEVVNELRISLITNVHLIEASLKEHILQIIQQGITNGWNYNKTADTLRSSIGQIRARRIVRTESVKATNLSALIGAKRTGLLMDKEWISARDRRVRGNPAGLYPNSQFDHWRINGARAGIDETFTETGELMRYPGDPKGNPADIINCRCTMGFVPRRDSNGRLIRTAPGFFQRSNVLQAV